MKIVTCMFFITTFMLSITSCSNDESGKETTKKKNISIASKNANDGQHAHDKKSDKKNGEKHKHDESKHDHGSKEKHVHGKKESKESHKDNKHDKAKHDHGPKEKHAHGKQPEKEAHKESGHKHTEKTKGKKHGGHGHGGHKEEPKQVELSDIQRKQIKLEIRQTAQPSSSSESIRSTGEVTLNTYKSAVVSPRIQSQITKRLVKNGDHVVAGQSLVKLTSVGMAKAQGELLLANQEWIRIKSLGKSIVSARRFTKVKISRSVAYSKIIAYGMDKKQLDRWLKAPGGATATGEYILTSPIVGTVVYDKFIQGQVVDASNKLLQISNESVIWVVAHIKPLQLKKLKIGLMSVIVRDNIKFTGEIIRLPHTINENTRTASVIIEFDNSKDALHAGEFVNVIIHTNHKAGRSSLTLPVEAVVRSTKGGWQVFVEQKRNIFVPKKVKIIQNLSGKVIVTGLSGREKIVIKGTFFLQSEIAKSGFDIHNH